MEVQSVSLISHEQLSILKSQLSGELFLDELHKISYATDASVYRKIPQAVAYPKNDTDLKLLLDFALKNNVSLTLRTAGTSLAGQCVNDGIIVDVSKYYTKIIAFDEREQTVTVEPGVIRDDLNLFLKPYGLFFGPNTSTSNRCMIGGMVGNNSSGTTSIQYGVTRDKVIALDTILIDGSNVKFETLNVFEFRQKLLGNSLENNIYKTLYKLLSNSKNQVEIKNNYPKKEIHRRNTGYAIDTLLDFELFGGNNSKINISKLLCGSEGTLAVTKSIKLTLSKLPPKYNLLVVAHFNSISESLKAVQTAMKHNLYMCELMDKAILDCTKNNREQANNRFFIQGDPKAILMLELKANSQKEVNELADNLITNLTENNFGYAHVKITGDDVQKVIHLRKAGLGVLGNIIGDRKAVACIEDTAVSLTDLPNYIDDFTKMMDEFQQEAIYYAHAGAGELHLRPILNLKDADDVKKFRKITERVAQLVKKYNGTFSGEHGDGIVRSEFIPMLIGDHNYSLLKEIKHSFDKNNILNKGKIINPYKMDESLRYQVSRTEPEVKTILNFEDNQGILRLTEKCNGSGDCRKPVSAGAVMCPSYRATKNEIDTTRARANVLREVLTQSTKPNKFNDESLKRAFDLCISCKACASECPSNVDVAILKAEFLYQYYKENKPSLRTKLFANNTTYLKYIRFTPILANFVLNTKLTKKILGIANQRDLPKIAKKTFRNWLKINQTNKEYKLKSIYLFIDEFTNNYDVQVGIDTYHLLTKLGYEIHIINHSESGRSQISKGFLDDAKKICNNNVSIFKDLITDKIPLVGIEPSAILTFRDEYLRLSNDIESAKKIAKNSFTIEEFIAKEIKNGFIKPTSFTKNSKTIKIHTHCHQKSLSTSQATFEMLNIPVNYKITLFNTGCCGMAGSFGYEKEHYKVSMKMGENSIFPKVRNTPKDIEISVAGTSCRHQIKDGTKRDSKHPVSLLLGALR